MEWNFVIPAASFFLVTAIVTLSGYMAPSAGGDQKQRSRALYLFPGLLAAALAWVGGRLVDSWVTGSNGSVHFLLKGSHSPEMQIVPWVGLVYFVAMVIGMCAHTTWDAVARRRAGKPPAFDKWLYFRPALVAPIIFLGVLKLIDDKTFGLEALLLSFQNGFFWQTVLSRH